MAHVEVREEACIASVADQFVCLPLEEPYAGVELLRDGLLLVDPWVFRVGRSDEGRVMGTYPADVGIDAVAEFGSAVAELRLLAWAEDGGCGERC